MNVITLTKELIDSLAINKDSHILISCHSASHAKQVCRMLNEEKHNAYWVFRYANGATVRVTVIRDVHDADRVAGHQFTNVLLHEDTPQMQFLSSQLHARIRAVNYPHPMGLQEFML